MTSLAAYASQRLIQLGDSGQDVTTAQVALEAAGYHIIADGVFGDYTAATVAKFQTAHGLRPDGVIGPITAALLDAPHTTLVVTAQPVPIEPTHPDPRFAFPHDDTASLVAFYGDPSIDNDKWQELNMVPVVPPWPMVGGDSDDGKTPVKAIYFHKKCAPNLLAALNEIWTVYGKDYSKIQADGLHIFSGAYNYRPIRGSSRLSCHSFGAAIDFDAAKYPMNYNHENPLPPAVASIFKAHGGWLGEDFHQRQDPMHIQYAHE